MLLLELLPSELRPVSTPARAWHTPPRHPVTHHPTSVVFSLCSCRSEHHHAVQVQSAYFQGEWLLVRAPDGSWTRGRAELTSPVLLPPPHRSLVPTSPPRLSSVSISARLLCRLLCVSSRCSSDDPERCVCLAAQRGRDGRSHDDREGPRLGRGEAGDTQARG